MRRRFAHCTLFLQFALNTQRRSLALIHCLNLVGNVMKRIVFIVTALFLASCGYVDYKSLKPGTFKGQVLVFWVGENNTGLGNGEFIYVPVPGKELTFARADESGVAPVISPQAFYTDGGSVPKPLQGIGGMSAWGYAPAYIIHDWLFVARKCVNDNQANPYQSEIVANMSFADSADIMGETIKTLIEERRVKHREFSPVAISWATAGPVSRRLWNETGQCKAQKLHPKHQAEVDEYLALEDDASLRRLSDRKARTGGLVLVGNISFPTN